MKAFRLIAVGLGLAGAAVVLWLVGGNAYARYRDRQADRAWVASFGTLQHLLDRYPKTTTNDTARRLEELVKPLGVDLTPKTYEAMMADALASSKATGRDAHERQAVSGYLTSQLEKPEASIDAPPSEVTSFFAARGDALLAVEEELLASPPPLWNSDPALLRNHQAIPNVYVLLRLQRALLAEALVASVRDNTAAASRTLEASWKLNQALLDVPEISCQMVALAIEQLQIGALRKVSVNASVWRPRVAEHNFKRSAFDAELMALWPSATRSRQSRQLEAIESRSGNLLERVGASFRRPYREIGWSDDTEKMRLAYLKIKDSPFLDEEVWKELVSSVWVNLLDLFRRVDRLTIDAELTDKVLQARQLRQENGGRWPTTVPGIEATHVPGARWIYSVSPQGTMSLSLSKEPHWNASGLVLPRRFTSS